MYLVMALYKTPQPNLYYGSSDHRLTCSVIHQPNDLHPIKLKHTYVKATAQRIFSAMSATCTR